MVSNHLIAHKSVGYTVTKNVDEEWLWSAPDGASDGPFESEGDANEAAWTDAARRVKENRSISTMEWLSLSVEAREKLIAETLIFNRSDVAISAAPPRSPRPRFG